MNILFCTDGSNISYNAINNFTNWVNNPTIDILTVIDLNFMTDQLILEDNHFTLQCKNTANEILEDSSSMLKNLGFEVNNKINMCGNVVDSILEILSENNYDFVVMGSNGKKGLQKWLGSVSQEMINATQNTLYISKHKSLSKNLVFAVEQSDAYVDVVKKAISSLNLNDKSISLVTSYEIPDYLFLEGNLDTNWILEIQKKQEQQAELYLNSLESILANHNIQVQNKVILEGQPAIQIIKYSKLHNTDLIICGDRKLKKLSKFLLGSVSNRILENSEADVLIFR